MDKFESAADAGISMITGEPVKAPVAQEKSSRALWAVSLTSLVAIASLSYVLVTDRQRIVAMEAELNKPEDHSSLFDGLNSPEVMQRVLAMSQIPKSSTTTSSSKTVDLSGSFTITKEQTQEA